MSCTIITINIYVKINHFSREIVKITYHNEKDRELAAHILEVTLSDNKYLTSEEGMLQTPLVVTWLLRSIPDRSTSKAAMWRSSGDKASDFSTDSHGHTFITPFSNPAHISPAQFKQMGLNH